MSKTFSAFTVALLLAATGATNASAQSEVLAEMYGRGVHSYYAGDYISAYESLTMAIDNGTDDSEGAGGPPALVEDTGHGANATGGSDENQAESAGDAELAARVDALLLDSGRPDAQVKTLGGTGLTHDWALSAEIVAQVDRPVFLAGGLRESNVAEAIAQVKPFGVDLCSGVRTEGGRRCEEGQGDAISSEMFHIVPPK